MDNVYWACIILVIHFVSYSSFNPVSPQIDGGACGLVLTANSVMFLTILGFFIAFDSEDVEYSVWWSDSPLVRFPNCSPMFQKQEGWGTWPQPTHQKTKQASDKRPTTNTITAVEPVLRVVLWMQCGIKTRWRALWKWRPKRWISSNHWKSVRLWKLQLDIKVIYTIHLNNHHLANNI